MNNISGFTISKHDNSKRIIKIDIEDEVIDKLIFPFNKFDLRQKICYAGIKRK